MTQKEALKTLLNSLDSLEYKYLFLLEWLEDINWHGENKMLWEKIDPRNQELINALLEYKPKKNQFIDRNITLACKLYGREILNHNLGLVDFHRAISYIFGWGLDKSFTNTQGAELVEELEAMI